jgi:hypothetical protein
MNMATLENSDIIFGKFNVVTICVSVTSVNCNVIKA